MVTKTIVILAKSYKSGGWCIAGRELTVDMQNNTFNISGGWIRPVSNNAAKHGALADADCRLADGAAAKIYDMVEIEFAAHQPDPGQPENFLISGSPWNKINTISPGSIASFNEIISDIWLDTGNSDQVSQLYETAGNIQQSLVMIKPANFQIRLNNQFNHYKEDYKKDIRASFEYNGDQYQNISITDPAIRHLLGNQYPAQGGAEVVTTLNDGDNYLLCVSLCPRFGAANRHYKLVATVFDHTGNIQG